MKFLLPAEPLQFACIRAENDGAALLKRQLIRATLRACDEIWKLQPKARILHAIC